MARRKSGEPRIGRQIGELHGGRVVEQCTEKPPVPVGPVPDGGFHLCRHPVCEEVGEPLARLVGDADGGVVGVSELGGGLADPIEGGVQFEPGADGTHRFQQLRDAGGELGGQALQTAGRLRCGFE